MFLGYCCTHHTISPVMFVTLTKLNFVDGDAQWANCVLLSL